jgi:hypothetical protein
MPVRPTRVAGGDEDRPASSTTFNPIRNRRGHEKKIIIFVGNDLKLPSGHSR